MLSVRQGLPWRVSLSVGLATTLVLAFCLFAFKAHPHTTHISLSVSIDVKHPGSAVPTKFLGLSFEMSSLRRIARYGDHGNLVGLLRSLGPGVLRFGGVSVDTEVAWTDHATRLPDWSSKSLDLNELYELHTLAARSGWRILLTVGLAHYEPRAAAREAAAAKRALGGWLMGIEIGNEPDAYARHGLRSPPWTVSEYEAQIVVYRRAIERAAPGLPIVGPDVSGSLIFDSWGRGAALHDRPAMLTGHHYPLGCRSVPPPTIARLLSPTIRRAEDVSLHRYVAVSRRGGIGFRLDETNSVSCGGTAGISDRFASALWAVDYIAHAMAAGVSGINLQGNPANCAGYTPLCAPSARSLSRGALVVHPEWYALLMTKALIGDRPLPTTVSNGNANIDAVAFLARGKRLHVLIVDDALSGAKPVFIQLRTGRRYRHATVLTLSAPSPSTTSDVRLGGQVDERDGGWHAPKQVELRANRNGTVTLDVAGASAVLVTLVP